MKKLVVCFLGVMLVLMHFGTISFASEETQVNLATNAKAAILMDADTGTILYKKNSDLKVSPASITKVMALLLICEAVDEGKIQLNDKVRTSEYAASMGGSQIFLEAGEEMTVEELIKGIAIASANDATVAMAEFLAGTEEVFVQKMNEKAQKLGMKHTTFVNSNGLPVEGHFTSAHDVAIMSRELLRYEWVTKYTGIYQDYLRKESEKPFWLVNTNRLVRFYPGLDGLKTGFTNEAMYCLAATAKKGDFRLIAVVMGEPDPESRNKEITQMLDYAFSQFTNHVLYKKHEEVTKIKVDKGMAEEISIITPNQIGVISKKGMNPNTYTTHIEVAPIINAPIQRGEVVGNVVIKDEAQNIVGQMELIAAEDSEKISFGSLLLRSLKKMMGS